jgi:hypothetical protein
MSQQTLTTAPDVGPTKSPLFIFENNFLFERYKKS